MRILGLRRGKTHTPQGHSRMGGQPSRALDMCSRFCPAPLGIVLRCDKLEFN